MTQQLGCSRIGLWGRIGRWGLSVLVLPVVLGAGPAWAVDLDIGDDAEYARLVSAMRAAEYVRSDVIVASNPKPRVYAVLAGMMAYAERNPNASDAQLGAFLQGLDSACAGFAPGDPDLNTPANLYAALRFAIIQDPALAGTDTKVGKRALGLLGITIPDPDGFESIQRRMVRYEVALARPLDYRSEVFDLLVSGFFGLDPAGNPRAGLPPLLDAYFGSQGFNPELGGVREDLASVNAGLAILPADYAGYELAIAQGPENMALRGAVTAQLDTVRARIDAIVGTDPMVDDGTLDFALATGPGLTESVDLAMNDPAYVQSVFDELQANLEATAEARAAAAAATYLMLQSDFADIGEYASYTRDYSELSLETNDTMANIQSGVSIVGNLAIGVAGFYTGDPLTAAGAFLNVITEGLGLADNLNAGPSVDEQIFDQVVALRQQVEEMRQEMNERFDRIDQQLNIMYSTMTTGFDAIGDQIGDLQANVDSLIRDMAEARSELRRLEAALYGVAQDILLTDLTSETNVVLDYRDENGVDLPYSGGSPDFITASEHFFTYATVTSLSEAFVGSRTNPTVTIDNADDFIGAAPVSAYLNDLAVLPQSLGRPPLTNSNLPGIELWSQAASAYAQLARENPWYFNYRYGKQLIDYNNDPQNESLPELDRIIQSGDELVGFVDAIRHTDMNGDSPLFDALVAHYKDAAADLQAQIDAEIADRIPPVLTANGVTLDYWMNGLQPEVDTLIPNMGSFDLTGTSASLPIPYSSIQNGGFETFTNPNDDTQATLLRTWFLVKKAQSNDPASFKARARVINYSSALNDFWITFWLGDNELLPDTQIYKSLRFSFDTNLFFGWFPYIGSDPASGRDTFSLVWNYGPTPDHLDRDVTRSTTEPNNGDSYDDGDYRIRITSRTSLFGATEARVQAGLYDFRRDIHNELLIELFDDTSPLHAAAEKLNDAEALLDAYVSIGMSKELNKSEVLRSALRAAPGTSELGLRLFDVIALIDQIDTEDSPDAWADPAMKVTAIDDLLGARVDVVADEIRRGLERPTAAPDYVGWVLAELGNLRDTAFNLAAGDTYRAQPSGVAVADAATGLLANDIDQEFRIITIDTAFDQNPAHIAPAHGSVSVAPDGSFTYQADPGFVGADSFNYRSKAMIESVAQPVFSRPATVVVVVPESDCGIADLTGDGTLNFFDVSAFLVAFNAQGSDADLTGDGQFNFFDVSVFLVAFSQGCP